MRINLFLFSYILILFSCSDAPEEKLKKIAWDKEKSVKVNKEFALEEKIQIDIFIDQHPDWKLQKTGSGLWFFIYKNGEGIPSVDGKIAQVELEVRLLDGTLCYKTEKDKYNEFEINHSDLESGIHEGVSKMRAGDKAKLIIPSHLAHGIIGDLDKIPPLATLLVDINLLNVKI